MAERRRKLIVDTDLSTLPVEYSHSRKITVGPKDCVVREYVREGGLESWTAIRCRRRGMMLFGEGIDPYQNICWEFSADILLVYHPTR